MSTTKPTGGPAFPQDLIDMYGTRTTVGGLSIRDYFAAKAMQGMLANGQAIQNADDPLLERGRRAYRMADAMLAARQE